MLSFPDKSGGRWSLTEFMKTGEREIALLFHRLAELQITPPRRRALDFGCGVGRLTQALARRAAGALGADISPVMIDLARKLNRYPGHVDYICTANTELGTLPDNSFDLIYTNIVLQHVAPELAVHYLGEFFRLLEPNGVLVFQSLRFSIEVAPDLSAAGAGPHRQTIEEFAIPEYPGDVIPKPRGGDAPVKAEFPMNGVPRDEVMAIIRSHGGRLAHLEEDRRAGPEWVSYRYFVVGR